MKKRLFLIFCGVMCLFLMLCSCGDDTENTQGSGDNSHTHTQSSEPQSTNSSVSYPSDTGGSESGDATVPETKCELNEAGHYWSQVKINKITSSSSTVAISGVCFLCGDPLYKVCVSVVDYDGLKAALSPEAFSSFTTVNGSEYTDYDKNSSLSWREEDNVFTADYYINSATKNSQSQKDKFQGYRFDNFVYNDTTKTYKYKYDENSYAEFGFADGDLIYYAYVTKNDHSEERMETLYLNYGRITIEKPDFVIEKYKGAVTLEKLKASKLGVSMAEKLFDALKNLNFDGSFEAFLLENDRLSVYFPLNSSRVDSISGSEYSSVSILIEDSSVISVTLGSTAYNVN